jgi:hypothetical protein
VDKVTASLQQSVDGSLDSPPELAQQSAVQQQVGTAGPQLLAEPEKCIGGAAATAAAAERGAGPSISPAAAAASQLLQQVTGAGNQDTRKCC